MLAPVREDTLGFHTNQLKWLGYPLAVLLVVNLTCMLYAVSRTPVQGELPGCNLAEVHPDTAPARSDVARDVAPQTDAVTAEPLSMSTAPTLEDVQPSESRSDKTQTFSSTAIVSQSRRWLSQWRDRASTWQAKLSHVVASLPGDQGSNPVTPDITISQSDTGGVAAPIATESPSSGAIISDAVPDDQPGLVIRNPASTGGTVVFLIDGEQVTLKSGQSRLLHDQGRHTVRFHRGGSFGNATHILGHGEYWFSVTSNGWALFSPADNGRWQQVSPSD